MIIEQNDYSMADTGEYQATLVDYEDLGDRDDPFNPGETKHQIKLVWKLEGKGEQWDWVNASLFPGSARFGPSKLYEIASLLLRANPPKKLDLDTLKGKSLVVSIKRTEENGKTRTKIDGYYAHSEKQMRAMAEHFSQNPLQITEADLPF
jgi:hypothetical protein